MTSRFNNISRKLIALLLAVIIAATSFVISTMTPSIEANAASNSLAARFFVNNATSDEINDIKIIRNNQGAVWENVENGVHFSMSYDKYNYLSASFREILPDCNFYDGFSISFYAKDEKRDDWSRFFEIMTASPYSDGNSTYLYAAAKGLTRVKNKNYGNSESGAVNIKQTDGMWHRYTITLRGYTLTAYSDGELNGSVTDRDRIRPDFYTNIANTGSLVFGASSFASDPVYKGNLRDFRVYNRALTEDEVALQDSAVEEDDGYYGLLYDLEHPFRANAFGKYKDDNNYISISDYSKVYNSLLYASDVNNNTQEYSTVWLPEMSIWKNDEKCDPRLFQPVTVMYYDGKNTPCVPVASYFRHWCTSAHNYNIYYYAFFLADNANGLYFNENWHGSDDEKMNVQWNLLDKQPGNISYLDSTDTNHHWGKYAAVGSMSFNLCYANYLYFNGNTFRVDEFYRKINPTWGMNFGNNGNDIKRLREPGTKPIYVINAKPLYDRISAAKAQINRINSNFNKYGDTYYTKESIDNYISTVRAMLDYNPSKYDFANDTENSVKKVAGKIQELIKAYDESVPTHTHTYLPEHTSPNGDINGYTENICVDGEKQSASRVYDETDWSAYDAILEVAKSNISNTRAYTSDSIEKYKNSINSLISGVKSNDVTKSQRFINNLVSTIDSYKDELVLNQYKLTFNYQVDNIQSHIVERVFFYGENANVKALENTKANKWTYEDADGVRLYSLSSDSIDIICNEDMDFTVYSTSDSQQSASQTAVRMYNKNGRIDSISYVDAGAKIKFTDLTYTIGTATTLAPQIPFYGVRGFIVNDSEIVYGNGSTYVVPNNATEINIKPIYVAI